MTLCLESITSAPLPNLNALKQPLAVVCHDAGATNLILGWLRSASAKLPPLLVVADGPACTLWQAQFPSISFTTLDDALNVAGSLLSGTGWASELEHKARCRARQIGLSNIAVVDHWVNYRQRFVRDGVECLPDSIWVSDNYALDIASVEFPGLPVQVFRNVYLAEQVEAVRKLGRPHCNKQNGKRVLYALEPIRQAWLGNDVRPGEFQALDHFISKLAVLGLDRSSEIRLRPHPSDPPGKYADWIAAQHFYSVTLAPDEPIADAVAWSDWVVGCESFVLIIGMATGRRVLSTLPPWGHLCRLPHSDLQHIRFLDDLKR
jgi:hypothetical protein